jgi:serine/threonine-protein kinase HipA
MARRSHSQTLTLWANGDYVGRWTVTTRGDMELQYDAGWVASGRGRPLSLSLPVNLNNEPLKGDNVAHYFEGLLGKNRHYLGGLQAAARALEGMSPL